MALRSAFPSCFAGGVAAWSIPFVLFGLLWGLGHPGTAQPTPDGSSASDAPFAPSVLPPDVDAHEAAGTNLSDPSRRVVSLTNAEREKQGRTALKSLPRLARIACRHNKDMLAHSYSGHEDSDGRRVRDRLAREHRTLLATGYGENVFRAWGQKTRTSDRAALSVESWMNSPPHRKNILRRSFTHIGACVTTAEDELRATQVFATVAGRLAEPLPWTQPAGDSLATTVAAAPNLQFRRYAFPAVDDVNAFDFDQTMPFQNRLRIPSAPGRYALRMAHLNANEDTRTFQFSFGPRIQATAP